MFCFQTCNKLLPECRYVLASGLTLSLFLRPQITGCSVLEYIGWKKSRPSPGGGSGESCLQRWCAENWKSFLSSDIWPVNPSQDTCISGFLGWRLWSPDLCPYASQSLGTLCHTYGLLSAWGLLHALLLSLSRAEQPSRNPLPPCPQSLPWLPSFLWR